ncbi:MAG: hypothetical protein ABIN67_19180 [Ferruginibacter sp.]
MTNQQFHTKWGLLLPLAGILAFILLYFIAAMLYPGGSQANASSTGFSWLHNYWCNLLNEKAMNGKPNTARPVAITGMFVLCISLAIFWYQFAGAMKFTPVVKTSIRISGVLSMITGLFLYSKYHDSIINISGVLGMFAIAGTFVGLYKNKWLRLFWFGLFNFALIGLNNFIYYTHQLEYLPVIQKVTFFSFLLWVSLMIIRLYKEGRRDVALSQ